MGKTIRELREERKLTREQVAAHVGVSKQAVYWWEHDKRMPLASQLRALAQLFDVSMDDIALPGDEAPAETAD